MKTLRLVAAMAVLALVLAERPAAAQTANVNSTAYALSSNIMFPARNNRLALRCQNPTTNHAATVIADGMSYVLQPGGYLGFEGVDNAQQRGTRPAGRHHLDRHRDRNAALRGVLSMSRHVFDLAAGLLAGSRRFAPAALVLFALFVGQLPARSQVVNLPTQGEIALPLGLAIAPPIGSWGGSQQAGLSGSYAAGTAALSLDFINQRYWWNGVTTLSAALTVTRADLQIALAPNSDGTWTGFAANAARVGVGTGLVVEPATVNRLLQSRTFNVSPWAANNITFSASDTNPVVGSQPLTVERIPTGTTTYTPKASSLNVFACGPGGNAVDAVANTRGGAGGGGGAFAQALSVSVTIGVPITVAVPAGGSGAATTLSDTNGVLKVSAAPGANGSGSTAGAGGLSSASTGGTKTSGGNGGGGSVGTGNRGGGGGGGAGISSTINAGNNSGRAGSGGGAFGGGGGGAQGGGITVSGGATSGLGGVGGTSTDNLGGGTGGTSTAPGGPGDHGGGGGGGDGGSGANANGGAGSDSVWTITSGLFSEAIAGGGGGGGGGGFNAGAGGVGGLCAGGGGGGDTSSTAGTGSAGGAGSLVVSYGSANATRITATANNATLQQTYTTASAIARTPSLLVKPVLVTGPVYLSQDGCSTLTDVSGQFGTGRFNQAFAPYDTRTNPTWCLQIANSGDVLDIDYSQLEDNAFVTTPIPTVAAQATRQVDLVVPNLASFPAFLTNGKLTALAAVKPGRTGTSVGGTVTQVGWTWLDLNGAGSSLGTITASISGTTMTVTDAGGVTLAVNQQVTGAAANTYISAQVDGTTGGAGNYSVSVSQAVASGSLGIVAHHGYRANAARKGNGDLQTGVTVIDGDCALNYGYDPQTQQYTYNAWNMVSFSGDQAAASGINALKGETEASVPKACWPNHALFTDVLIGSQTPTGTNNLVGPIGELIVLYGTAWSAATRSSSARPTSPAAERPSRTDRTIRMFSEADYSAAAARLGVPVAAVRAVADVESNGVTHWADGRPPILFEAHWFSHFTDHRYDADHPAISSYGWNPSLYRGGPPSTTGSRRRRRSTRRPPCRARRGAPSR
jgi:hypothetical protein